VNRKSPAFAALAVTLLFLAFTCGFFVGKSQNAGVIIVPPTQTAESPATSPTPDAPPSPAPSAPTPAPASPTPNAQPAAPDTPTPTASAAQSNYTDGKLRINSATAAEFTALPGIGETLAQRIIDYRAAHGDFAKISDITKVSGIGEAKFAAIKDLITVS
jgi:competence protein ComEA